MSKSKLVGYAVLASLAAVPALAQVKLTADTGNVGSAPHLTTAHLASVVSRAGIGNLQTNSGQTLSNSLQAVGEGKTDYTVGPLILVLLMKKGLAMYSGLGKDKGAALAGNLRLLYPYSLGTYQLVAFQSAGIGSYSDLKEKKVHNGPPRGGALTDARTIIKLVTGMEDGKDYTGRQVAWPQASSIFLDGSVSASIRPGTFPADWMPVFVAAGKVNLISVPKKVFESKKFQRFANSPGHAPRVVSAKNTTYGPNVRLVSEDGVYRSVRITAGDVVHKRMDAALVRKMVAAFIESLPEFYKKAPFIKGLGHAEIAGNKTMCGPVSLKYHPGAVAAWEAAGYSIPDCAK